MQRVDLSLAVSYLPAALCILRLNIYMIGITCLKPGEDIGGLLIIGNVLYLDRLAFTLTSQMTIFDSNAVLLSVYISHIYLYVRNITAEQTMSFMCTAVGLWWALTCLALIIEPPQMRRWMDDHPKLCNFIPPTIMAASLVAMFSTKSELETSLLRYARSHAFALLSVFWVYIVGIKKKIPPEQSNHFISRFSPALYLPSYVCFIFFLLSTGCLLYHYYKTFLCDTEEKPIVVVEKQVLITVEDETDTEEMFRLARQGKQN